MSDSTWTCPKCGREFKNIGQEHYCGEPPKTIDEYLARLPEEVQPLLHQVRDTLRAALPEASEKISWRMPTYWKGVNIIHFAAFNRHFGLYPGSEGVVHFAPRLAEYKTSKGAIQFSYDKPVPFELIAEIARWCYGEYAK
jgi:uncharacterized protein YdhG (YjbR/CyaY superfamily)